MLLRTSFVMLLAWASMALAAPSQPMTALTHVRVIDGTGRAPLEDATVVIEGNHILSIQPKGAAVPAAAQVMDLHGDTVMPGLINAHGHLALIADGQNSATSYTAENVLAELRQYESYGVTAMLSLGLNRDLLYQIRQQQREGKVDGATVFTADRGIGVPDAAPPLPASPDQIYRPASAGEARAEVDDMAKRHPDIVKIWVDSLGGTKPEMQPEIYRAVIDEAHKHHLRVAAHIYYLTDAKTLVNDGVDVLAQQRPRQARRSGADRRNEASRCLVHPYAHGRRVVLHLRRSPRVYADRFLQGRYFTRAAGNVKQRCL